ncbi:50S ribosomal protein L24 [Candidatus Dojkabacteria bacterium]|nr:50S ribosomal protein L24 [Candidatus Dojkabacteria bacterium]
MKIRVNDTVKVLLGKDAGRTGVVQAVNPNKNLVLVGGLNIFKKHVKKDNKGDGGIVDISKPIQASKLAVLCPSCEKTTRIGFKKTDGKATRVCKKCGKPLEVKTQKSVNSDKK